MRVVGAVLFLATTFILAGCEDRSAPPVPEPHVMTSARSGPAGLVVTLDRDAMRTVDRLRVRIEADATDGAEIDPPTFDPASTGWTVISRTDEPLAFTDAGPVRRSSVVLEPFLEGTYELPPVTLEWAMPSGERGVVSTEPLRVEVSSVLAADDNGDLAGPVGMVRPDPPAPDDSRLRTIAVGGGIVLVIVGVTGWWLAARRTKPADPSPADQLRALARSSTTDADRIGAAVAECLRRSRVKSNAAREIIDAFDRARYGRMPMSDDRARSLLNEAIDALERGPEGSA
ncbi:MAG: hypothetical protein RIB60_04565 [Phycisphaerales bacterium]